MDELLRGLWAHLSAIRDRSPLVLNLTNYVAMDLSANALLALGASPIMAHGEDELEELVEMAGAVVLNIGTLDAQWITRMRLAAQHARRLGKPVVIDPVGAGATRLRTQTARELIQVSENCVVRGNASEIAAVFTGEATTHGVDSVMKSSDIVDTARAAVKDKAVIIAISGATDYIVRSNTIAQVFGGDPMMTRVTAMGCTASALIGAFAAVHCDLFSSSVYAMSVMGLCGEEAARGARGPGSFRAAFLDALFGLNPQSLAALRVTGL